MIETHSGALEKFRNSVGIKSQLRISLFSPLPFYGVDKTWILLSISATIAGKVTRGKSPQQIIERSFETRPRIRRGRHSFSTDAADRPLAAAEKRINFNFPWAKISPSLPSN